MNLLDCFWFKYSLEILAFKLNHLYKKKSHFILVLISNRVSLYMRAYSLHIRSSLLFINSTDDYNWTRICARIHWHERSLFISKTPSFKRLQTLIAPRAEREREKKLNQLHNSLAMASAASICKYLSCVMSVYAVKNTRLYS